MGFTPAQPKTLIFFPLSRGRRSSFSRSTMPSRAISRVCSLVASVISSEIVPLPPVARVSRVDMGPVQIRLTVTTSPSRMASRALPRTSLRTLTLFLPQTIMAISARTTTTANPIRYCLQLLSTLMTSLMFSSIIVTSLFICLFRDLPGIPDPGRSSLCRLQHKAGRRACPRL